MELLNRMATSRFLSNRDAFEMQALKLGETIEQTKQMAIGTGQSIEQTLRGVRGGEVDAIQSAVQSIIAGMGGPAPAPATPTPTATTARSAPTSTARRPRRPRRDAAATGSAAQCNRRIRCRPVGQDAEDGLSSRHGQSGSQPVHPVQHCTGPGVRRAQGSHGDQVRQQPEPGHQHDVHVHAAPANGCIEDPDGFGHHCVDSGHQRHVAGEQQLPDEDRLGMEAGPDEGPPSTPNSSR